MQWKASRKSRQILGRGVAWNGVPHKYLRMSVLLKMSFPTVVQHTRIARQATMRRVQQLHSATGCIGEKFGVFWSVGWECGGGSGAAAINARSYAIRFYNNIPVNRMLQTISNVKRKSKQHIKLVRARLRALGLSAVSGSIGMQVLSVAICVCLLQFYGQIAFADLITCERRMGKLSLTRELDNISTAENQQRR